MKTFLSSLFFTTLLLLTGCTQEKLVDATTRNQQFEAEASDKFVASVTQTKSGDFVHFRNVYWRIESIEDGNAVIAGVKASNTPVKTYNPRRMGVADTDRFAVNVTDMRGQHARACWTIRPMDEGYLGLLNQWTNLATIH